MNGEDSEKSGTCGKRRGTYTAILLQAAGKKPYEKRRRRRENNFKMDLKNFDMELCGLDLSSGKERGGRFL